MMRGILLAAGAFLATIYTSYTNKTLSSLSGTRNIAVETIYDPPR
jgi:hypothetical protein